jgi:hypothetical protein
MLHSVMEKHGTKNASRAKALVGDARFHQPGDEQAKALAQQRAHFRCVVNERAICGLKLDAAARPGHYVINIKPCDIILLCVYVRARAARREWCVSIWQHASVQRPFFG